MGLAGACRGVVCEHRLDLRLLAAPECGRYFSSRRPCRSLSRDDRLPCERSLHEQIAHLQTNGSEGINTLLCASGCAPLCEVLGQMQMTKCTCSI